ncbi:hypothetical protein HK102_001928 [Quaeritorhiza haematococci]|nr:hypothetical protein HK102_001928 [Quaeritorhiza haematococci]
MTHYQGNFKGNFSFRNDNIAETRLTETIRVPIEKCRPAIARVYFVNNASVEIPIPEGFQVYDRTNKVQIEPVVPGVTQFYVIAWSDGYEFTFEDQLVLSLNTQRQWAVYGSPDVKYADIQQ